jgi:predicted aspartyl protease
MSLSPITRIAGSIQILFLIVICQPAQVLGQSYNPVTGPSFECQNARLPDEITICNNPDLSLLDLQIGLNFIQLKQKYGYSQARNISHDLLLQRRQCGNDAECIRRAQVQQLNKYAEYGVPLPDLSHSQVKSGLPDCPNSPVYWGSNCQGKHTWPNGEEYVGEWQNNKPNGQGTYTFPSGQKYVGEFRDGKYNGQGTYTFPSGEKYVGEFRDGKPNGFGIFYNSDGSIRNKGVWIDNQFAYPSEQPLVQYRPAPIRSPNSSQSIQMVKDGGVYVVPIKFNDILTLDGIIDSGAADVSIPADVILTLIRAKTVVPSDFLPDQTYVMADGTQVPSKRLIIRKLTVGNFTVENVTASVADVKGSILLGQSFLEKFKSWSMDNNTHTLILE